MKKLWFIILFIVMAIGAIEILHTFVAGQIATGANDKIPWGLNEVAYMFLTGISAGAYIISILALLGLKRFRQISRLSLILALVLVLIAAPLLLIALGRPERFWMILVRPNPTSVISWGTILLCVYPIICILYGFFLMRRDLVKTPLSEKQIEADNKKARFFGLLGIPIALSVHGYTGVLLAFVKGRALWNTPMMPVIFLTSALVSGIALIIIISQILNKCTEYKTDLSIIKTLANIMFVALLIDGILVGLEILTSMYGRTGEHFEIWTMIISGRYSILFIVFELIIGFIIPVILLISFRNIKTIIIACIGILIGIFVLRYSLIIGGQVIQAYGGPLGEYTPTLGEWSVILGLWAVGGFLLTLCSIYLPLSPKNTIDTITKTA